MLGHPDVFAQHGTTTALGHPERSSQSINVHFTALDMSLEATHTSNITNRRIISYWDIQTT